MQDGSVFDNNTVNCIATRLSVRHYDIVVIMLEYNDDVVSQGDNIELIVGRLGSVAALFRTCAGAETVYVGDMFPRFPRTDGRIGRYSYKMSYNHLAQLLNIELEKSLSGQCLFGGKNLPFSWSILSKEAGTSLVTCWSNAKEYT